MIINPADEGWLLSGGWVEGGGVGWGRKWWRAAAGCLHISLAHTSWKVPRCSPVLGMRESPPSTPPPLTTSVSNREAVHEGAWGQLVAFSFARSLPIMIRSGLFLERGRNLVSCGNLDKGLRVEHHSFSSASFVLGERGHWRKFFLKVENA